MAFWWRHITSFIVCHSWFMWSCLQNYYVLYHSLGIELVEYFYWSKFRKKKGSCYLTLISILILNHITFKKIYISFNFKSNCFQPNFCEQNWSQNILYKSFQQHIVKYLSMNLTNKSKMNHNYFAIFWH